MSYVFVFLPSLQMLMHLDLLANNSYLGIKPDK